MVMTMQTQRWREAGSRACRSVQSLACAACILPVLAASPTKAEQAPPSQPDAAPGAAWQEQRLEGAAPAPPAPVRQNSIHGNALNMASSTDEFIMPPMRVRIPLAERPARAFAMELEEEAIRYRDTSPWVMVPDDLDEDFVREKRARAAEGILGEALEASLETLFRPGSRHSRDRSIKLGFTSGVVLDESPSWTVRRRNHRSGVRLDLPLTAEALKFHAWKELSPSGHGPSRMGTTFSVDPWDQAARFAVTLAF